MEKVKVRYTGKRAAPQTYFIRPGGRLSNAQGYPMGAVRRDALMTRVEAEILVNPDADAMDTNDNKITKMVGKKEVPVRNRELVDVGAGKPLPDDDTFEIVGEKPKAASTPAAKTAKATEDK